MNKRNFVCVNVSYCLQLQATRLNKEKVEYNDHLLAVEEKIAEIKQSIKSQPNMDIEDPDSRSVPKSVLDPVLEWQSKCLSLLKICLCSDCTGIGVQ
jgi:hypothetical protein